MVGGMIELIHEGQACGQLRDMVSARQLAEELLLLTRGVVLDWLWSHREDARERAAYIVNQYLYAYATNE